MSIGVDIYREGCVTSCMTCYVISNHTSFCYIVDSANEMHLRVIAQPCAGVPKTLQNVAQLHIVVFLQ